MVRQMKEMQAALTRLHSTHEELELDHEFAETCAAIGLRPEKFGLPSVPPKKKAKESISNLLVRIASG